MKRFQKVMLVLLFNMSIIGLAGNSYAGSIRQHRVKTIFDYKQELKLTNKQTSKIKETLIKLNKRVTLLKAELIVAGSNLQALLKKNGDIGLIDKKLRDISDYRRGIIITDLISSRNIKGVLTEKQLKEWKGIQAENSKKRMTAKAQ